MARTDVKVFANHIERLDEKIKYNSIGKFLVVRIRRFLLVEENQCDPFIWNCK